MMNAEDKYKVVIVDDERTAIDALRRELGAYQELEIKGTANNGAKGMSDGLTNFAFSPDYKRIERGFIAPINEFLRETPSKNKAVRALNNTLNTPQAKKLNSDDKTLLWAKI